MVQQCHHLQEGETLKGGEKAERIIKIKENKGLSLKSNRNLTAAMPNEAFLPRISLFASPALSTKFKTENL